jgi:non-heme chloroperoxidase
MRALFLAACLAATLPIASAQSDEVKKTRVRGVELHYIERGQGTPVVFVHGGLEDYRAWLPQMERFSQRYRAIAYSRRYNSPNRNSPLRPDHSAIIEADDLAALMKKLKLPRAHVVGLSYGAYAALFLAARHPEQVRSLVLSEPPVARWLPDIPDGGAEFNDFMSNCMEAVAGAFQREGAEKAVGTFVNWFAGKGYLLAGEGMTFDQLPGEVREYLLANARELEALALSSDAFPSLPRESAQRIQTPVLILSGQKTLKMFQLIDGELERLLPNKERVIIPDATHEMWVEKPEVCQKAALAFLAKH